MYKIEFPKFENKGEIKIEINRYEEYKKELNKILELNTYITFKDFLNVANEIYEKNFLNFDFPIIMIKNKYKKSKNL